VKGLTGKTATLALEKAGIVVNRNTIPYDTRPPLVASGLRMGTPALTTRGFGPDEMRQVARFMARVLADPKDESVIEAVRHEVEELSRGFPVPGAAARAVAA
jgi:glycine hydroxymethyltransferase